MPDNIQSFIKESAFEEALTNHLLRHGWNEVIMNPSEKQLVQNWANILYDNNRSIDQLGDCQLTTSEMQQVIDQVNLCGSPYAVNKFINGQQVCIKRDNESDTNNYGKEVYLKILTRRKSLPVRAGTRLYDSRNSKQPRLWLATDVAT